MRAIWKGSLSFGLINIPVHLYPASQEKGISFSLLHKKDLSRIRYAKICKNEEKEIPPEEIVKGYEFKKGEFVVMDDRDFEKIDLKKTQTIEILNFTREDQIDTMYYVKPYFLEPENNSQKAYSLLREALRKSKKVAVAKYILYKREHLAVIKSYKNTLILNELRYRDELIDPAGLNISSGETRNAKEIEMALRLVDQLTADFRPEAYKDTFVEEVLQIAKKKAKGQSVHPKTEPVKSGKIEDIMSLLKASLEEKKKPIKKSRLSG